VSLAFGKLSANQRLGCGARRAPWPAGARLEARWGRLVGGGGGCRCDSRGPGGWPPDEHLDCEQLSRRLLAGGRSVWPGSKSLSLGEPVASLLEKRSALLGARRRERRPPGQTRRDRPYRAGAYRDDGSLSLRGHRRSSRSVVNPARLGRRYQGTVSFKADGRFKYHHIVDVLLAASAGDTPTELAPPSPETVSTRPIQTGSHLRRHPLDLAKGWQLHNYTCPLVGFRPREDSKAQRRPEATRGMVE